MPNTVPAGPEPVLVPLEQSTMVMDEDGTLIFLGMSREATLQDHASRVMWCQYRFARHVGDENVMADAEVKARAAGAAVTLRHRRCSPGDQRPRGSDSGSSHTQRALNPANAIEIPAPLKAYLGLDDELSWIVLTKTKDFLWPRPDLRLRPNTNPPRFDYGMLPPRFFLHLRSG